MFNSLLWLESSEYIEVEASVISDLDLERFYKTLIDMSEDNSEIIGRMCLDIETIEYRHEIMKDFLEEEGLCKALTEGLQAFSALTSQFNSNANHANNFYYLVDLIIIVETSILCLEAIYEVLTRYNYKSQGLKQLCSAVEAKIQSEDYGMMKEDLKTVRKIFSKIRGAEILVEMDTGMRPIEAFVTKLMEEPYESTEVFKNLVEIEEHDQSFLSQYLNRYEPMFQVKKLSYDMIERLEYGLRDHKKELKKFVKTYSKVEAGPFIDLLKEVLFYQSSVEMFSKLNKAGLPLTIPKVLSKEKKTMKVKSIYNLKLSEADDTREVVYNDFEVGQHIYILTGANSGGKTTFTQAIGQIQILTQLGLLLPASSAEVSITSGVYTHFPVIEEETVEMGRLGKECSDYSEIFDKADRSSLILMNESFASTSHLESLQIASEVVRAMKAKGVRAIFNTHLHELLSEVKPLNKDGVHTIIGLTSGTKTQINSYIIQEGESLGTSYAMEIANRYGVTFDLLKGRLEVSQGE